MADAQRPNVRLIGTVVKPLAVKLAQTVGLTTAAFLAGQTAASTYVLLPSILKSPAPLLSRQLRETDEKARRTTAPGSLALSALFGYFAYREPTITTRAFKLYVVAAALLPTTLPLSYIFIRPLVSLLSRDAYYNESVPPHISSSTPSLPHETAASSTVLIDHPPPSTASHDDNASVVTFSDHTEYQAMSTREFVSTLRASAREELSVHQIADMWGWFNLARAGIVGAGALVGMWAAVTEDQSVFELFQ